MTEKLKFIELTAEIVGNYVANNTLSVEELPALINTISKALEAIAHPVEATNATSEKQSPAQVRKSIRPDALVSFLDGRPYKTLKRHLAKHGMSIAEYKERFGLPSDYPSTAPDYSARRSEMAKKLGLGQQRKATAAAPSHIGRRRKAPPG